MSQNEEMRQTFARNLRALLEEREKTQIELAKYLGVTDAAVNTWCRGKKIPRMDKIDRICSFLCVDRATLMCDESARPSPAATRIPLLGVVAAGIPIEAIENIEDYEEIPSEWGTDRDYFALRVRGDSMEPLICDGDRVIVQKLPCVDSGQIAVILVNGCEATVKQVKLMKDGIMLVGMNPAAYSPCFYTAEEIEKLPIVILGRVVEIRRSV